MEFASRAAVFLDKLPMKQSAFEYSRQLLRSSASVGSNLEEADGSLSKRDFINKMGIARKEARESRFWLRLIKRVNLASSDEMKRELHWLVDESNELRLILSSIINKVKP